MISENNSLESVLKNGEKLPLLDAQCLFNYYELTENNYNF